MGTAVNRCGVENLHALSALATHELRLSKGVGISHQDLLFSLQSNLIKLYRIIAGNASAGWTTIAIIREAVTVELKTA